MDKKVLSLGAIAMDVVLNSYELPKDDGFALILMKKCFRAAVHPMYQ